MQTHAIAAVALAAALVFAGGCSNYASPAFDVVDARIIDRTDEGIAVAFTLDAANTNDEALPLRQTNYSLELDGKRVFHGVRSAEATLRRRGTQQIVLPAGIAQAALPSAGVVHYRLFGSVEYITPGAFAEVLFDTGVRRPDAAFSQEGTIDLSAPAAPIPSSLPPLPTPTRPADDK